MSSFTGTCGECGVSLAGPNGTAPDGRRLCEPCLKASSATQERILKEWSTKRVQAAFDRWRLAHPGDIRHVFVRHEPGCTFNRSGICSCVGEPEAQPDAA